MTPFDTFPLLLMSVTFILLGCISILIYKHMRNTARAKRYQTLQLLKSLRVLIADIQKHRGLSNGLLSGDTSLKHSLQQTRSAIAQNTASLQQHKNDTYLVTNERWQGHVDHWQRLKEANEIKPENNLQQHHAMIRNLIFLAEDISNESGITNLPEHTYAHCIWREVMQTAEWAGQARALGTGMAAKASSTPQERIRMRFLCDKIQELSVVAFAILAKQTEEPTNSTTFDLRAAKNAVNQLIVCIQDQLLNNNAPTISAKDYFNQATQTIDVLLDLVDETLTDIEGAI
ncbi:nitrate- and nitrite sensing domain-containing protein [Nitrincola nitratireducens]|uniref:Nitrate and nitrite sensing n=1 Tax=Nitrincola nitratireducens TaxID=1229521 RepID=W9VMT9_9GAMM|nr:nitrate- and nitrite sensing domain-containing protein [Nitrincola nitratireducens]EXJ11805.1 Nitrate and nitrite sensing [Nitrincola nitratireducens]